MKDDKVPNPSTAISSAGQERHRFKKKAASEFPLYKEFETLQLILF